MADIQDVKFKLTFKFHILKKLYILSSELHIDLLHMHIF